MRPHYDHCFVLCVCFQPGDLSVDAGDGYEEDEEDEEGEEEEGLEDEEEEDDPVSLQHQLTLFSPSHIRFPSLHAHTHMQNTGRDS